MRIIILGVGRVGASIAAQLVHEKNDITVVDHDYVHLKPLQDKLDLNTIQGEAANPRVLREAGAEDADLLVAVTASDETNLVACKIAKLLFNIPTCIARIRQSDYLHDDQLMSAEGFCVDHIISPEQIITQSIYRLVKHPEALQVLDFADGKLQLVAVTVTPNARMAGKDLRTLGQLMPDVDSRVAAIYRQNERVNPDGDTRLVVGDEVFFLAATHDIPAVLKEMRGEDLPMRRIIIAGGGNIGFRLAKKLQYDYQVKIIEENRYRCEWLAEHLEKVLVLHGSATDEVLLEQENIDAMDLFCALTSDDEDNVMSSLLAKRLGVRKVISLVNRDSYVDLLQGGRLDIAISPSLATIGSLLAYVRRGDVEAVHSLRRGAAEAMEIVAHGDKKTSRVVGRMVGEIKLPKNTYLGAIVRGEKVFIAHHDTMVESGDHVIVFAADKRSVAAVEQLFTVKFGFF
jgi:trk system potassium uptake protein TrkA